MVSQAATTLTNVTGTATFGGTATLTATLTASATSQGIAGQTITFALDGSIVGTATTDSNGVATLTGIPTFQKAGTDTGGVVASFAGAGNNAAAINTPATSWSPRRPPRSPISRGRLSRAGRPR